MAAGLLLVASQAGARPIIDVGTWVLQPDTPNQPIPIFVEGEDLINGLDLYVQIGEGGVETLNDPNAPVIQHIDPVTGTLFEQNNAGAFDLDNFLDLDGDGQWDEGVEDIGVRKADANSITPGIDLFSGFEGLELETADANDFVGPAGLLATIYVSTEGLTTPGASWPLGLSDKNVAGPTDFGPGISAPVPIITDGRIVIAGAAAIPEPSTFALAGLGLIGLLAFRRLRSR